MSQGSDLLAAAAAAWLAACAGPTSIIETPLRVRLPATHFNTPAAPTVDLAPCSHDGTLLQASR